MDVPARRRQPAKTLEDVAQRAGVSRATVSLVLRDSREIPERTKHRVRRAMAEIGYRPNRLAAGVAGARSHIAGLVVTDLTFPPYAEIAVGVEERLEAAGYSLIVANSHESHVRERVHLDNLLGYRADGLLIAPVEGETEHLAELSAAGVPYVCINRELPELRADFCGADSYAAMRTLVAYLAGDLGHSRIAILAGTLRTSSSRGRLAGWRDELLARGALAPEELDELVVTHPPRLEDAKTGARELIDRGVAFTAVVCVNDVTAVAALSVLHWSGRRVPEDVSVASFGGLDLLSPPDKQLTAVVQDYRETGRQAAALLMERMDHAGGPPKRTIMPTHLRIGQTTRPRATP